MNIIYAGRNIPTHGVMLTCVSILAHAFVNIVCIYMCNSALHPDGRVGITEEELEEIVLAVQEDAGKASLPETAAGAVGVLTTGVSMWNRKGKPPAPVLPCTYVTYVYIYVSM